MRPATPRLRAVLLTAAGAGLVWGPAAPAVAASDSWKVPSEASITVRGHGFGHGHGMSQHGAEGAAAAG